MKIIYFDIATFILVGTLFVLLLLKKPNRRSQLLFLFMLVVLFITTGASFGSIMLDNAGAGNDVWKFIFHGIYLLFHVSTLVVVIIYICSVADVFFKLWHSPLLIAAMFVPLAIWHLLLTVNLFAPIVYHINENGVYTRDFLFAVGYVVGALYFGELVYTIVKCRKIIKWDALRALLILFPVIVVAMLIESFFPYIVIEPFVNGIAYLVMFVDIVKPDTYNDEVTGVANEQSFKLMLTQAFYNKKPCKILLVGIVNYLSIAELLGGQEFEKFDILIANRLKEIDKFCRSSMYIAHLGDAKFRIIIGEPHFDTLNILLDGIFNQLGKEAQFGEIEVEPIPAVSVLSCPDDVKSISDYVFFSSIFPSYSENKITFSNELINDKKFLIASHIDQIIDNAIRNNLIQVYYQPIYDVKQKKFVSSEALMRLEDPKYGWIDTETIVKAAEKSGAIHKLGDIVFYKAMKFSSSKEYRELGLAKMDLNLSVAECLDNLMPQKIDKMMSAFDLKPKDIDLEITETAATMEIQSFIANVNELHNQGFEISLDDFGSGYSNVRRLVYLPFSVVKFDRSLVLLDESEEGHKVVSHMVDMIKEMGYKIIVEGIEEQRQLDSFVGFGVDYIQGWYFSKALPDKEFLEFIKSNNSKSK